MAMAMAMASCTVVVRDHQYIFPCTLFIQFTLTRRGSLSLSLCKRKETMAELIIGSFVDSLAGRTLSSLFHEIGLTRGVETEFNDLVDTLSFIRGYLRDAEKRQVDEEALKIWLKQLQNQAYKVDDLLDDFNTEAIRRKSVAGGRKKMVNEVSIFFSSSNRFIYANRMAHRIKDLKKKLDSRIKDSERFKLESIIKYPSLEELHHNRPLTVPSDYERYVVGRDEDKNDVIKFLLDPNFEENLSILSIVGFGGMGKTTLARLVFKDERLKDHFQQKIWVCVSTNFVAENILRNILQECVGESRKDEIANLQMNGLHDKLRAELGEKKFLLVLDDVWNEDGSKWLTLQNHLPYGAKGSKMLVTTRSFRVANTVGSHKSHNLSGLPKEESLALLMKMANKKEDEWKNKNLEKIAKRILKKCGGFPLAIMTIGRLLSTRVTEAEWSDLLEDFSRIEQEGDIMPTLKISYDFLPSHLKQCFAYCCLFPKDYRLDPNELVRLWMAQGFIFKSSTTGRRTLHDVGKEYFMELASRSFFQDFERDRHGNITRCKMHDLMHDLAIMVAGDNYTTMVNGSGASDENIPTEVRHVSMGVDRGSYNLKSLGPNQRIIRSLLTIDDYHRQVKALSGDISSFRNLRALRLHSFKIEDVAPCISKLKHLRSLDLSWSRELRSLPNSIGKLLNLETLILYGCGELESLPRGVTKLVNLRHLATGRCESLTCMPRGIGNLTNLEELILFRVGKTGNCNEAMMDELRGLTGLRELTIDHLWRVKKESDSISTSDSDYFWIDKSCLQRLHLSWRRGVDDPSEYLQAEEVLERLKPNPDLLKSLIIEEYPGTRLPSWSSLLHNLVEIEIKQCDHIGSIPPLDQLPSLKSISLDHLQKLEWIEVTENKSICLYPSLERVYLEELPILKGWKRKRMDVNRSGDQTIHSSSPFFIPSFSRKVHVSIYACGMLSYMRHDKKGVSLQLISIKYKDLEELWRNRRNVEEEETSSISTTQMGTLTFVPLSSVPFHTVTSLHLENLEDTEELPSELFQSLSRLQSLQITECHHIRSIPPLDQLPSLKSIQLRYLRELEWIEVTEKSICLYPSLEVIDLYRLPMLKGWKRKRMDVNRSGDQTIHSSSSSLFFIPSFSRKVHVRIYKCEMLSYMRHDKKGVSLQLISIKYKDLEELWRNRRNVEEEETSSISTTQMGTLTFVPLSSVPLHTVTSLRLENLEDTEELSSELFQSLSRLQSLEITECHHIRSIPPLDQLSSLESILLHGLPELEWIEVTENKSICLYPSLKDICLYKLPMLKGWKRKRMDGNRSGDQTIHSSSSSLFFIPSFSRKFHVEIYECEIFSYMCHDKKGVSLQVRGMKYKDLEELWRRNRSNVEECSSISTTRMGSLTLVPLSCVPLHTMTSLDLHHLDDTEELPSELFQSLSRLQSLEITDCYRLKSLSGWAILRYLCSLERLEIHNCKELDLSSMDQEEDNKAIQGIPNSQTKMRVLILYGMDKMKTLPPWIQYLPKLETLLLDDCKNMETLPGWFSQLTSLKRLQVFECGELSRRCQRDTGECWPHISHIENVDI